MNNKTNCYTAVLILQALILMLMTLNTFDMWTNIYGHIISNVTILIAFITMIPYLKQIEKLNK